MKTITVTVPDQKYPFFKELLDNLRFVKVVEIDDEPIKKIIRKGAADAVGKGNKQKPAKRK